MEENKTIIDETKGDVENMQQMDKKHMSCSPLEIRKKRHAQILRGILEIVINITTFIEG